MIDFEPTTPVSTSWCWRLTCMRRSKQTSCRKGYYPERIACPQPFAGSCLTCPERGWKRAITSIERNRSRIRPVEAVRDLIESQFSTRPLADLIGTRSNENAPPSGSDLTTIHPDFSVSTYKPDLNHAHIFILSPFVISLFSRK